MERTVTFITPVPPYDFHLTAAHATYFHEHYGADRFCDGVFQRLLDLGDYLCLVKVRSPGSIDSPRLELELNCQEMNDTALSASIHQVSRLLGTDQELESFYGMALKDPGLAPLTRRFRGLHIPRTVSVWEALVMAILGQQVSSHVSRMLRNLLVRTYGHSMNEEGTTYNTFPGPRSIAAAGEEGLWTIKLGKRKARYIVDIAAKVATGELDLEGLSALPDEEVLNILTNIRGVGLWTAGWLLIRGLCRPDAFPHEDLALRRTMALLFKDESLRLPEEALRFSRQWSPFRSFVTTYMFAAMRSGRLPSNS